MSRKENPIKLSEKEMIKRIQERTRETMKKREARKGQEPEMPSKINASKRDEEGFIEISFSFHDQEHRVKGKGTVEEFTSWINEYVKTAETCTTCDQLLMPGSNAGVGEDGGYTHMTDDCSMSLLMLAGRVNATGQVVFPEEWSPQPQEKGKE